MIVLQKDLSQPWAQSIRQLIAMKPSTFVVLSELTPSSVNRNKSAMTIAGLLTEKENVTSLQVIPSVNHATVTATTSTHKTLMLTVIPAASVRTNATAMVMMTMMSAWTPFRTLKTE